MPHAISLAAKTADVLKAIGNPCTLSDGAIHLDKWDAYVHFYEGREDDSSGMVRVFPTIVTRHSSLPRGFARELGVGIGSTLKDAVDHVSATWILLFFPLLKFVFEERPHDCLVSDTEVRLPRAGEAGYRLFAGPLQLVGLEGAGHGKHYGQTLLWDTFAMQLLPMLNPGVHHLRCYTGRTHGHLNGDVFVDGRAWLEGSELLRQLAADVLPVPDDSYPMCAFKQHLIVRPEDLPAGIRAGVSAQVAQWHSAIVENVADAHRPFLTSILRGLVIMSRDASEEEHAAELQKAGESIQSVGDLVAFLQSAAARVIIGDRIAFSPTYYWSNFRTRRAVQRRYDETPLFTAAVEAFELLNSPELADEEIAALAYRSAELKLVTQLHAGKTQIKGARISAMFHPTDEPVDGEDLDVLMKPAKPATAVQPPAPQEKKPWWRLW